MHPIQLGLVLVGLIAGVVLLSGVQVEVPTTVSSVGGTSRAQDVTDPGQTVRAEFYGDRVQSPGVAGPGRAVYLLSALTEGDAPRASDRPAAFFARPALDGCTPRPPAVGEVVVGVQTWEGGLPTRTWLATGQDIADATRAWVEHRVRRSGLSSDTPRQPMDPAHRTDVILTETAGPVYLVLQTVYPDALWHVVTAPGVRVAHVVLVGPGALAVSLPDPATTVQVAGTCAPRPAREPAPHWDLFHRIGSDASYEANARRWFADYDAWFRATFGAGVEDVTYGTFAAAHVLAGPPPAAPVPWRPFDGATVIHGPLAATFTGTEAAAEAHFATLQTALATAAAGGDLGTILPPSMERTAAPPAAQQGAQP